MSADMQKANGPGSGVEIDAEWKSVGNAKVVARNGRYFIPDLGREFTTDELVLILLRFPPGSVRRAVAVLGDAWAQIAEKDGTNAVRRAEIRDAEVMRNREAASPPCRVVEIDAEGFPITPLPFAVRDGQYFIPDSDDLDPEREFNLDLLAFTRSRFPAGSVRRAVAVLGDAWALIAEKDGDNAVMRAEIRDAEVMRKRGTSGRTVDRVDKEIDVSPVHFRSEK